MSVLFFSRPSSTEDSVRFFGGDSRDDIEACHPRLQGGDSMDSCSFWVGRLLFALSVPAAGIGCRRWCMLDATRSDSASSSYDGLLRGRRPTDDGHWFGPMSLFGLCSVTTDCAQSSLCSAVPGSLLCDSTILEYCLSRNLASTVSWTKAAIDCTTRMIFCSRRSGSLDSLSASQPDLLVGLYFGMGVKAVEGGFVLGVGHLGVAKGAAAFLSAALALSPVAHSENGGCLL